MSKKYQVFISSTFKDLEQERTQVLQVVVDRGHIPVALERLSAADESVQDVILRTIRQSQIYVVILGHRYGSRRTPRAKSYTHMEYEAANKAGLTVLPFVLNDAEVLKRRARIRERVDELLQRKASLSKEEQKELEREQAELDSEGDLEEFRKQVGENRYVREFPPGDANFMYYVASSLEQAERMTTLPGWVLEPAEPELREAYQSLTANPFIREVVGELSSLEALDNRCLDQSNKKAALAHLFVQHYLEAILARKVNLFFESGSTVAYVAKQFGSQLRAGDGPVTLGDISTNNVLAFLQLWLIHRVPCSLFPWGPPEKTYGASFGFLEADLRALPLPSYPSDPLPASARAAMVKLRELPYSIAKWQQPSLLLGAVSGLQIGDACDLRGKSLVEPKPPRCKGPHVGSWRNKVFKRFMYDTHHPIMIFMTDDKIDCPIEVGKYHFILDVDLPWETFLRERPIAFCIGAQQQAMARLSQRFQEMGFQIICGTAYGAESAIVARNACFMERFERVLEIAF